MNHRWLLASTIDEQHSMMINYASTLHSANISFQLCQADGGARRQKYFDGFELFIPFEKSSLVAKEFQLRQTS